MERFTFYRLIQYSTTGLRKNIRYVWFLQVCGSRASGQDSCSSSPCGGLGCVDSEGQPRCGGQGCDGVVTKASSSLRKAQDAEQEIISAMEEVEKLSKMVSPTDQGGFWCLLVFSGPGHDLIISPVSPGVRGQSESRRGEAERSGCPDEDQQNQTESRREQRGAENTHQADQGLPHT